MSEGIPHAVMAEANHLQASQPRRSARFGSPGALRESETKMALGVKRSITVRKIAPRKTVAISENNKENTPRRSQQLREKGRSQHIPEPTVSTPDRRTPTISSARKKKQRQPAVPSPVLHTSSAAKKTQQTSVPSPILASSPPTSSQPTDEEGSIWIQKVRRSYSRLSDSSPRSPRNRETLFGFEKLNTPEVIRSRVEDSRTTLEVSGSFVSMLEADERCPEPDLNIPGVAVVKEKKRRRRRKVQQIDTEDLEVLAAQMNAEFREAEEFALVVE
ncbi:sororin [Girardinichthys multiradiatus]|uniref:sororin n=1 Tax=Girardinichthys multiradiatus TaxID=208333 RepID=UPI001FAC3B90|nr:sororin [Girardinichthys multiradiatus]